MMLNLNKRLLSTLIFVLGVLFIISLNYTFYHAALPANVYNYVSSLEKSTKPSTIVSSTPSTSLLTTSPGTNLHYEYDNGENDDGDDVKTLSKDGGNDWCSRVAGTRYLDDLASTWAVSCSNPHEKGIAGNAGARLICFQVHVEEEPDNFCVARDAVYIADTSSIPAKPISKEDLFPANGILPAGSGVSQRKKNARPSRPFKRHYDQPSTVDNDDYKSRVRRDSTPWGPSQKQWSLNCTVTQEWNSGVQAPYKFRSYFEGTGVGTQLRMFDMNLKEPGSIYNEEGKEGGKRCNGSIMLVKLEGGGNIWHTLMEVWSAALTLDALKKAKSAKERLFTINSREEEDQAETIWEGGNIKIYIQKNMQSEKEASPVFGLWKTITGDDVKDIAELKDGCYKSVILPLAGGGNPFWKDHWRGRDCEKSSLVEGFVEKVLKFYGVEGGASTAVTDSYTKKNSEEKVKIKIIGRKKNRKILHLVDYIKTLQNTFPDAEIEVTKLEELSITEQLRMIRNTEILIGVTGAGLTHTMFMRRDTAVIELTQPDPFVYFGFGNLARMIGVEYFAVGAQKGKDKSNVNWQEDNVLVDEQTFVSTVGKAIAIVKSRRPTPGWGDVN
ncbi:hypothetical protein TWF718_005960 [Orbilia javanica]|uniref:EGF domain-specific O-linked N-acetylglucosamine transferase n=1 Tax=Orbilia javanica TaxID=47235 RepID=A0AAN8REK7_9PEZI